MTTIGYRVADQLGRADAVRGALTEESFNRSGDHDDRFGGSDFAAATLRFSVVTGGRLTGGLGRAAVLLAVTIGGGSNDARHELPASASSCGKPAGWPGRAIVQPPS